MSVRCATASSVILLDHLDNDGAMHPTQIGPRNWSCPCSTKQWLKQKLKIPASNITHSRLSIPCLRRTTAKKWKSIQHRITMTKVKDTAKSHKPSMKKRIPPQICRLSWTKRKTEHEIDVPILWVAQWNRWRFRICEPYANTKEYTTTSLVWIRLVEWAGY